MIMNEHYEKHSFFLKLLDQFQITYLKFKKTSHISQQAFIVFTMRYILHSIFTVTLLDYPIPQAVLYVALNFIMISYYSQYEPLPAKGTFQSLAIFNEFILLVSSFGLFAFGFIDGATL